MTILRPVVILITSNCEFTFENLFVEWQKKRHGFTIMYHFGHYGEPVYQFRHYEELHCGIFCSGHSALLQLNIYSWLPCQTQNRLNYSSFENVCPDISLGHTDRLHPYFDLEYLFCTIFIAVLLVPLAQDFFLCVSLQLSLK